MLPPGVAGKQLGTLHIRLLNCSLRDFTSASFQLWGTETTQTLTCITKSVDLPLIGTVHSVQKYLDDASPITVKIMGADNHQIGISSITSLLLVDVMQCSRQYSFAIFESDRVQISVGFLRLEVSMRIQQGELLPAELTSITHEENEDEESKVDLLDELLDLCGDDMTAPSIPTLGTCTTSNCTDPYDAWISTLERQAASPPTKPISSSGLLKVNVSGITIVREILDSFCGNICIYLKYSLKQLLKQQSRESSAVVEEMMIRKHLCRKTTNRIAKTPLKNKESVQLLDKSIDNEICIEMALSNSEIQGSIEFCLSCSHQSNTKQKNTTTSARSTPINSQEERVRLAMATIDLRTAIANQQYGDGITIDMMSSKKGSIKKSKVGALNLSLHLVSDTASVSTSRTTSQSSCQIAPSLSKPNENQQEPHHLSVLLSNFLNAQSMKQREQIKKHHSRNSAIQPIERDKVDPSMKHDHVQCQPQEVVRASSNQMTFQPVRLPPLWMAIVVSKIKLDSVVDLQSLRLSCNIDTGLAFDIKKEQQFDTQCSWQFAVQDREIETISSNTAFSRDASPLIEIYVMLKNDDDLNSFARIAFSIDDTKKCRSNTNGLPSILKSGWFDIVDSDSHSLVGKIYSESCLGTLKQTRSFPEKCRRVVLIQQWWRKTLISVTCKESRNGAECTNDSIHSSLNASVPFSNGSRGKAKSTSSASPKQQQQYYNRLKEIDDDSRTNENVGPLIGSSICLRTNDESPSSSTDSLFEEWSRQSTINSLSKPHSLQQIAQLKLSYTSRQSPLVAEEHLTKEISHAFRDNEEHEDLNETIRSSPIEQNHTPVDPPEDDNFHINFEQNDGIRCKLKAAGEESLLDDSMKGDEASSGTVARDELQVRVHVRRVGGLNRLLNQWCEVEKTSALPVSGLFISFGNANGNKASSEEVELHRIFTSDDIFYSQLISIQESNRELDLDDFKATILLPNHESDLSLIQTQSLLFKLWFVPVVTSTVARAFSKNQMRMANAHFLNGCKGVATAAIPLYDLYTLRAYFDGRVTWNLCNHDTSQGFIAAEVHKLDDESNDASNSLDRVHFEANAIKPQLSHIKPTNLQRSVCHSPEVTKRQSIDPPSCSSLSNKRKIYSGISACRSIKRSRVSEASSIDARSRNDKHGIGFEYSAGTDIHMVNEQEIRTHQADDPKKDSSGTEHGDCDKAPSIDCTSEQSKPCSASGIALHAADHDHSSESKSSYGCDSKERCPKTPMQHSRQGLTCVETCERGSSPVLVALRCADIGVCTSPFEERSHERVEQTDSEMKPAPNLDIEDDARSDVNKDYNINQRSNSSSLNPCPGQDDQEGINSVRPRRLRSYVMQNYFASPRANNCGEFGSITSVQSPVLFPSSSSILNRRSATLSSTFRSPTEPKADYLPADHARPRIQKPDIEPTTRSKVLSNRERIERIFSGKK